MNQNHLSVVLKKPAAVVFEYVNNPKNTPETELEYFEWVDSVILKEPCSPSVLQKLATILN